ncbi:valine--tRNA ligase [Candidatus Woesebacteria bacterium RIFCSPHIGHO2_01_FULL_38_9]|uniref:Valine--tRNA ligase n=1 Tax=Candidatus Woesebacteria bacterium RIFCSPHIGHO2_01_FULL_38_9 TaxID=1802492 RepID=A0A1F7Y0D6_9BACT|nr:MAG: valine--tRNA ligase [Candidatus Woesebacteria bacterium RIFCSPHIGHO2_01_FULL_38_9]
MEKTYNHQKYEEDVYKLWEKSGAFTPKKDPKKKPYTIVLPPPNASGKMHTGNVLMIAIEDILIRWKRMQGYSALWIPGTDHAGFETQITFERRLKEQGKSRFDFDRATLYKKIWVFVQENKHLIEDQIRSMGASVDWTRNKFTLDPDVLETVVNTFKKMFEDRLVYRADYMVNYCPTCGTTFADLEVNHKERKDPLYYMKYGPFVLATVRPETKFGDTAVAVHPNDKRYKKYIGKEIEVDGLLGKFKLKVIADKFVDPEFGTGVVKVTPAHDKNDYEAGKRHHLEVKPVIGLDGKLNQKAGRFAGLTINEARKKVVEDLKKKGLLEKIDENYVHTVAVCYKGGHDIEPTILPNWFVKVGPLKEPAHEVVKKGKVKIYPKWQEVKYHRWMESMNDWPISRQVVWGIRIPAWYSTSENLNLQITFLNKDKVTKSGNLADLLKEYSLDEIRGGLQTLIAPADAKFSISDKNPGKDYLQETDTFDTWFSSGQWPLVTLGYPNSSDFKYFYPADVLETAWEILRLWVSRMIMFGLYLTGKPPFKDVYLHGIVRAMDGRKMSKSLGNVINPEEYQEEFGTDALRMGLISGTANGHDFNFPRDKAIAYRNFANKIWNIARFINLMFEKYSEETGINVPFLPDKKNKTQKLLKKEDKQILDDLNETTKKVDNSLEKYRFADAAEAIYHFMWDRLASDYLEKTKNREDKEISLSVLRHVYFNSLKLLHPFMPFITEVIWQELKDLRKRPDQLLISTPWPVINSKD